MALRIYLLPKIGDGLSPATGFRPKYLGDGGIMGRWSAMDYGKEAWMLVAADVTPAEHTALVANADVTAVPVNLDQQIGGALATVQAKLELANLPAHWVTSTMTYRVVLRWVCRLLLFAQRCDRLGARLLAGVTLDDTVGDLPVAARQLMQDAAESFGLDTSSITLSTTMREALREIGSQMPQTITLGGVVIA